MNALERCRAQCFPAVCPCPHMALPLLSLAHRQLGNDKPAPFTPTKLQEPDEWAGPFIMEGCNARVVQLSNALLSPQVCELGSSTMEGCKCEHGASASMVHVQTWCKCKHGAAQHCCISSRSPASYGVRKFAGHMESSCILARSCKPRCALARKEVEGGADRVPWLGLRPGNQWRRLQAS